MGPLFKATLTCSEKTIIHQGGTSCFAGDTLVCADRTLIKIRDIKPGERVLSYNENTGFSTYREVLKVHRFKNTKRTVRIKLKNGHEIVCTEDHQFMFDGKWLKIKEILAQLNTKNDE